ncbi:hypothetical protein [Candidatus Poriferisodalis sp.]|uniref:hypothetical protein n=1 Tax=Candidatus Poriferisodalis sp. TaxID=3101277 RepID=UPI003B01FDE5
MALPKHEPDEPAPVSQPYTASDEAAFRLAAQNEGTSSQTASMWLDAATCGAGLTGSESAVLGPGNIEPLKDGLAIRVGGPNARLVPIRDSYDELVRTAIQQTTGQRFITKEGKNAAYAVASGLQVAGLGKFSLRRARATWICAHLRAGTPLGHLRKIAGPLGADTLIELLRLVADEIDEQDAALMGRIP